MNLGPHAVFIWLSYAIVGVVVAALIGWLLHDGQRWQRRLAELDAAGVRRRSASPGPAAQPEDPRR